MLSPRSTAFLMVLSLFPCLLVRWATAEEDPSEQIPQSIGKFLESHCSDCHTGEDSEAGFDINQLQWNLPDEASFAKWVDLFDRVALGKMPPEDAEQPSTKDRASFGKALGKHLNQLEISQAKRTGRTRLRRLNRTEYENTLHDLLGIDTPLKHLLPEETPAGGFDTVSAGLRISSAQIEQYLLAADLAIDSAIRLTRKPKIFKKRMRYQDEKDVKKNLNTPQGEIDKNSGQRHRHLFRQIDDAIVFISPSWSPNTLRQFRPPATGTYRIRISAYAHNTDAPVSMMVFTSNWKTRELVQYFEVSPGEPQVVQMDVNIEAKEILQIVPLNVGHTNKGKTLWNFDRVEQLDAPGLAIQWVEVEGPLIDSWPPESTTRLVGEKTIHEREHHGPWTPAGHIMYDLAPGDEKGTAKEIIERFAARSFRRPLQQVDAQPFIDLANAELESGRAFDTAIRVALRAILTSSRFHILEETPGTLDDHALASRLSYFLWSTMPDEELMDLAELGELGKPDRLKSQVHRMIRSPKANQFVKNFVGQWLDLRSIDETSPDSKLYPEYDEILQDSMIKETEFFFDELLQHDLPVRNFIDSDFVMLNRRMAEHYEMELPDSSATPGETFRKVSLPKGHPRGGVLTHASILKVTANGTVTSPVRRGIWVQSRILGQPPPPPPPVDAVEPDTRGTTTIREQLAKHRNSPVCNSCHRDIDPPGFALESFDVIGRYRERYRSNGKGDPTQVWVYSRPFQVKLGLPVDASGMLAGGETFDDIRQFKSLLLEQEQQVLRNLAEKLIAYGTGAEVRFADRTAVKKITQRVMENGGGLRSLIHEIIHSELFRNK